MTTAIYRSAAQINTAMIGVYQKMFLATVISLITALVVSSSPALMTFFFTGIMKWITIFAPLAMVLLLGFKMQSMTYSQATAALYGFSALMGLSFATIFVVYAVGSIVSAFMGASSLFLAMTFYGYFTKRSLESMGSFLFIGLIGIVIASVINVFIGNDTASMVISALAVIIFTGLTAYDTQRIRELVSVEREPGSAEVMGALSLYLNFINIFLSLLQLFGNRNE